RTQLATSPIYTLSLHDALPISRRTAQSGLSKLPIPLWPAREPIQAQAPPAATAAAESADARSPARPRRQRAFRATEPGSTFAGPDRKSTRLNSSHDQISYAVFC